MIIYRMAKLIKGLYEDILESGLPFPRLEQKQHPYTGLIFEGGGVLGISYAGAIHASKDAGILNQDIVNKFGGSSVGAIAAGLLSCKVNEDRIVKELLNMDFEDFMDDSWGLFPDVYRLWNTYGWYKGNALENWYGNILKEFTGDENINLYDINRKYNNIVKLCVTNLETEQPEYYTYKNEPTLQLKKLIRYSAGYPFLFKGERYKGKLLVDGGLSHNYPINIFDKDNCSINMEILGFKLIGSSDKKKVFHPVKNIKDFAQNTISVMYNLAQKSHVKKGDWKRTIPIDIGTFSSLDFKLTYADKKELYIRGYESVIKHIKNNEKNNDIDEDC